jgi:hypothetical protein
MFTYSIIDIDQTNLSFKIIPVLDPNSKREIYRLINYYLPLELKKDEKPICKFIQLSHSLINEKSEKEITNLDKVIEKINKIDNVDLVVHTGNVTQNSYEQEFRIAKNIISKLKYPYIVVPGYTDSKPPAWEYWERYFGEFDPLFENEKLYFQGLNSTTRDSTEGFIGRKKMNNFIDKVLSLSHQKIFGVCCFHSLIPTPLSVWRTELIDSGDILSQFAHSQIDLCLNSSPGISFNIKVDHTIFSNGGNINSERFDNNFMEIDIYKKGKVVLKEHNLRTGKINQVGNYNITIFI